jgi:5,5'-dehydrodivanillate O-demethylase oxygenase subunit
VPRSPGGASSVLNAKPFGAMLEEAKNQLLTRVGPGTPMGNLLRRYWMPIAAVSEFDAPGVKPVRLFGEDLVLYKDLGGRFGLVDRHCPHRRADLSYGFVEECGLRCNYHGWLFSKDGRCLEQPYDDLAHPEARFKDKVRIGAYPVEAKGGLLWAYLGPQPAPLVPNWEPFTFENVFVQIVFSEVPCNWLQCQENSIDPVHFEWMHRNWSLRLGGGTGPYAPRHRKLAFDEFPYGFVYKRVTEDIDESDPLWTVGRVCLWPNALFTGHFEWRVPVDDANTLSVTWHASPVPSEHHPFVQTSIPSWKGPIKDPRTGQWITTHVMNQDFVAWLGQGVVSDRQNEHLGASDRGVILMRKRLLEDLEAVERGEDPKCVIRDPKENEALRLPIVLRDLYTKPHTRAELEAHPGRVGTYMRNYIFQSGQPDDVRLAYEKALMIETDPTDSILKVLSEQQTSRTVDDGSRVRQVAGSLSLDE